MMELWIWIGKNEKQLIVLLTLGILIIAGFVGYYQYQINKKALSLDKYAEIFAMPQSVINQSNILVGYNILIKNVGSYPIYVKKYILNGDEFKVGSSVIPSHTSDNWYTIPIPKNTLTISLEVFYEDINEENYKTNIIGSLNGNSWGIKTEKKEKIN